MLTALHFDLPFVARGNNPQSDRDRAVIEADETCDREASELEKGREARASKMSQKQREVLTRRRAERADAWVEQLPIQVRHALCVLFLDKTREHIL